MNDIKLIVSSDSPFPPWVRDAVRELQAEVDRLRAELKVWKPEPPKCPKCKSTKVRHSSVHYRGGLKPGWYCHEDES